MWSDTRPGSWESASAPAFARPLEQDSNLDGPEGVRFEKLSPIFDELPAHWERVLSSDDNRGGISCREDAISIFSGPEQGLIAWAGRRDVGKWAGVRYQLMELWQPGYPSGPAFSRLSCNKTTYLAGGIRKLMRAMG